MADQEAKIPNDNQPVSAKLFEIDNTESTPKSTEAESSSSTALPTKSCANCKKAESDPEKALKPCSKCQSVEYCSRDCQKTHWKTHKKICAAAAQEYAMNADLKMASAPRVPQKEGFRKGLGKWQFDT